METQDAKPAERMVVLFEKGESLWLFSRSGNYTTSVVYAEGRVSPAINVNGSDEVDTERKFRKVVRQSSQSGWRLFYYGPVLNG